MILCFRKVKGWFVAQHSLKLRGVVIGVEL